MRRTCGCGCRSGCVKIACRRAGARLGGVDALDAFDALEGFEGGEGFDDLVDFDDQGDAFEGDGLGDRASDEAPFGGGAAFDEAPFDEAPFDEAPFDEGLFAELGLDAFDPRLARQAESCALVNTREVLERFDHDRDAVRPHHQPTLGQIARCVAASQGTANPVRILRLVGHADRSGPASYNLQLGRRRAEQVRLALQRALDALRPGLGGQIRFRVESRGERRPISAEAARNRRVEVFVRIPGRSGGGCGAPSRIPVARPGTQLVRALASSRQVTARLVLFADDPNESQFRNCATRWAREIRAIADPMHQTSPRVGPAPYQTGEQLIAQIRAARRRVGPLRVVHVFGHGFPSGVMGPGGDGCGLYARGRYAANRSCGGRFLDELPKGAFAPSVTFVLHNCKLASDFGRPGHDASGCRENKPQDNNFCRALLGHLRGTLKLSRPRVFCHCSSGCAGRNVDWREYSSRSPAGARMHRALDPTLYRDLDCC